MIDYCCGWIQFVNPGNKRIGKWCVGVSVVANIGLLAYFKYFDFFIDNINLLATATGVTPIPNMNLFLPVGISFYTFQTISYQVDLYRGVVKHQRNLVDFSLFVSLFPQLVAGPIVRYKEIEADLKNRIVALPDLVHGLSRFIVGLGKKVLIADPIGQFSEYAFSRSADALPFELAWLGIFTFVLQIYFDFDSYSDMAIGLGRIFGFYFPENFNYPYKSKSMHELWQRWHMTLMRWLRDYMYMLLRLLPGGKKARNRNVLVIFLACGLWHGADWTFVLWGLCHAVVLIIERTIVGDFINKLPHLFQHLYTLSIWTVSGVFFRAESTEQSFLFLRSMFGFNRDATLDALFYINFDHEYKTLMIIGFLISIGIVPLLKDLIKKSQKSLISTSKRDFLNTISASSSYLWLLFVLVFSMATVVSVEKTPFIYFQF